MSTPENPSSPENYPVGTYVQASRDDWKQWTIDWVIFSWDEAGWHVIVMNDWGTVIPCHIDGIKMLSVDGANREAIEALKNRVKQAIESIS